MIEFIDLKELISLYKKGYFPMADSRNAKTLSFFKPLKRFIIPINDFHIPKKLINIFKKRKYEFKINADFEKVINLCKNIQRKSSDSWINNTIVNTYIKLNKINYSHSVECYENNNLHYIYVYYSCFG